MFGERVLAIRFQNMVEEMMIKASLLTSLEEYSIMCIAMVEE